MRKTSWVWLAGMLAWLFSAAVCLMYHATQQAELSLFLAALFAVAWLFYRQSPR